MKIIIILKFGTVIYAAENSNWNFYQHDCLEIIFWSMHLNDSDAKEGIMLYNKHDRFNSNDNAWITRYWLTFCLFRNGWAICLFSINKSNMSFISKTLSLIFRGNLFNYFTVLKQFTKISKQSHETIGEGYKTLYLLSNFLPASSCLSLFIWISTY